MGVSGHNVKGQIDMINKALEPVVADGTVAGIGLWEVTLSTSEESGTDHAAKWETSNMMFFYPDLVDLAALGDGPLAPKMKPPDGIGGLDPRKHASLEIGRRNAELASRAIGRKAKELLQSLRKTRVLQPANHPSRPLVVDLGFGQFTRCGTPERSPRSPPHRDRAQWEPERSHRRVSRIPHHGPAQRSARVLNSTNTGSPLPGIQMQRCCGQQVGTPGVRNDQPVGHLAMCTILRAAVKPPQRVRSGCNTSTLPVRSIPENPTRWIPVLRRQSACRRLRRPAGIHRSLRDEAVLR